MRFLLFLIFILAASDVFAFSYETGGCATSGCASGEQWLHTNANEIDSAIDAVESEIDALQAIDTIAEMQTAEGINVILATEIDTAAELNALTTDTDMVLDTDIGVTVQALDTDLTDLADGELSGSKVGTGISATNITTGTIASTARLPSEVIEVTEIDTIDELNTIIGDGDFLSNGGTYDLEVDGAATFSGTLQGRVATVPVTGTTSSPDALSLRGGVFICTNAGGCDITLPTAAAGYNACWYDNSDAGTIIVDAAAGDEIILDGTPIGTAEAIDSAGDRGDFVCILAIDSTYWITLGRSGAWVDGGAD